MEGAEAIFADHPGARCRAAPEGRVISSLGDACAVAVAGCRRYAGLEASRRGNFWAGKRGSGTAQTHEGQAGSDQGTESAHRLRWVEAAGLGGK
jgi:hypothetical protein